MAANLSTAESILKEFYVAPIQEQLNNEVFMLQLFETEAVDWQGRKAIVPVHLSRNSGVAFGVEGGPLPTAGNQGYERLEIPAKFAYGVFGFTGQALEFSDTDRGSFEPVMSGEMKRLATDVRVFLDKASFTGGQCIGFVWQQQNNATWQYSGRVDVNADPSYGVAVGAGHNVRFISLATYGQIGVDTQVNSISSTSLVLNAAIDTTASADGTVFAVLHLDTARAAEVSGINDNLCNPDYFTVDRSLTANEQTRVNSLTTSLNAALPVYDDLSLDSIQVLLDRILLASNSEPDMMVINPVHRQSYTTLLQGTAAANVRIMGDKGKAGKGDAGFTDLGYANIPFKTAQHCPKGTLYLLAKTHWGTFQRAPGDFAQTDGKLIRQVPGFDIYNGFWKHYLNFVCKRTNAQGILTGVSFIGV